VPETLLVTGYPLDLEYLGGGAWVDRHIVSQLTDAGLPPAVFPVATMEPGEDSIQLEVRNDPGALLRVGARMLISRSPYAVAKFVGSREWRLRAELLNKLATGKKVVASQFPSLLLCETADVKPAIYVAHNLESSIAKLHNPFLIELLRDSRRLRELERRMISAAPFVAALSLMDMRQIVKWNASSLFLPIVRSWGHRTVNLRNPVIGFLGKASWPPNKLALTVLLQEVLPALRWRIGGSTPELLVAGRGTEKWPPKDGVRFLGEISNLEEFYSKISMVVIPRLGASTGVSVKMLEAMERGIPVIVPRALADAAGVSHLVLTADTIDEIVNALVGLCAGVIPETNVEEALPAPLGRNQGFPWASLLA
jgi:hypothetical protein